ncbi:MAG: YitT family protein [Pyrinomonadaceae bacterium]|nr:YitT family protein [Pyrinomonadaceae bacterium]
MKRLIREALNILLIVLGILSAGLGLKGFLLSSRFIDGGVTGVSMLLSNVLGWRLSILILVINLPFIVLGYRQIGRTFAIKSILAITGLSLCLAFVKYPDVTPDKLLTAVFGGFFIGAGIGLAIRGGAVLDGTEIAALLISKSSHLLRVGDVILLLNVFIFSAAAFFLGIESALYSMLTYFAASKTIDFLIHGVDEHTAITIISDKSDEIREAIIRDLNRGVTIYKGEGGLDRVSQDILFCVVTRLEIGGVKTAVREIDPSAFIVVYPLADAEGGVLKKLASHP